MVEVTAEDIKAAKYSQECACLCPIALAAKRATGVTVEDFGVYQGTDGEYVLGLSPVQGSPLPAEAGRFVRAFDRFEAVSPFTFSVELP